MFSRAAIVALTLVLVPCGARAADLVVWWDKGFYAQEDEALTEVVAAFEQQSGKEVELVLHPLEDLPAEIQAALETGRPPDFAFGLDLAFYIAAWAHDDRLVDLTDAIGSFGGLFDQDALDRAMLVNAKTGRKALYGLPIGRSSHHLHVWTSHLERAGFTLADIPNDWQAFWSFWCDQVQPAVREAENRDDIWGLGVSMSMEAYETWLNLRQFMIVHEADYVTDDGHLVIDDPEIRQRLVNATDSYTALYRNGCTPPASVAWGNIDNNQMFLAQTVVMTANETLSLPNALSRIEATTTIATAPRSSGHSARTAGRSRSRAMSILRSSSRKEPTRAPPRSSCAFWWLMGG